MTEPGTPGSRRTFTVVTAVAATLAVAALSASCSGASHPRAAVPARVASKPASVTFSARSSLARVDLRTRRVRTLHVGRFFAIGEPSLSPTGRLAFVASRCASCTQRLFVMQSRRPVALGAALSATWLSASKMVVSTGLREETEVRVVDLSGRGQELTWLSREAASMAIETERELTVAPNGRTLVFSGEGRAEHHGNYVADLARRTAHPLAGDAADGPSFAPDGERIAFQHATDAGDWDVCVAKLADIRLQAAPSGHCFHFPGNDRQPAFLPTGRQIVFSSDRASPRNGVSALYLLDLRTGAVSRLTPLDFDATSPKVAPDGRSVIFVRRALVSFSG